MPNGYYRQRPGQGFNISMPYAGNALKDAAQIQAMRQENALRQMALEQAPQERQYQLKERGQEAELKKYSIMGQLMRSVQNSPDPPSAYRLALQRYERIFGPGESAGMPETYDPEAVRNVIDFTTTAQERIAQMGLYGKMATKKKWGTLKEGITDEGKRVFFRIDDEGNVNIVKGMQPKPEKGIRLFDKDTGQIILDTTGGAPQAGKVLPAGEASQVGEFSAYIDTMREIENMINTGQIHTGPLEFINKKVDDWGVMPKTERIRLRNLVARLPGLMYAMRGKQLSDKELEVALNIMPRMEQEDAAFVETFKNFYDYLTSILAGKKEAFKGAGYQTGGFPELPSPRSSVRKPTIQERGDELQGKGFSYDEIIEILRKEYPEETR